MWFCVGSAGGTNASCSASLYEGGRVAALAINPSTPSTIYAGTNDGVFKSTSGGASWTAANTGLIDPAIPL